MKIKRKEYERDLENKYYEGYSAGYKAGLELGINKPQDARFALGLGADFCTNMKRVCDEIGETVKKAFGGNNHEGSN